MQSYRKETSIFKHSSQYEEKQKFLEVFRDMVTRFGGQAYDYREGRDGADLYDV